MNWIDNNSTALLQKSLEYTWERQRVASENIANKSTPGYKAKYIEFEDELQNSIQKLKTNNGSLNPADFRAEIDKVKINIKQSDAQSVRLDGNNVNTDVENMEMARTQLQYQFLVRQISDQFTRIRMAIEGR